MVRSVIKTEKGFVIVFDEKGEQVPEYQGQYEEVKDKILRDAPPDATFCHVVTSLRAIPREEW
ncbi:unnamed protein product [marine sediment metagenome]|uniref:Uncharacterized protein n=1 Tax=marine sediment metagenome TaxID=412755 RepID=X0YYQ0_9ZZZZ